ncbi:PAS domain-containing sensor histidine kinase [Tautonia sociabilis]|uniref:histidine kinase n=1 Tax=Tautonia sociabilis TaxID=2080755 RepID=A0A432MKB0_9BACT|nr:PAS domain S-box protein [Tautonia sociabilis]RUL87637.1 PAS domain S-box protein [Tautonia sociabilis]
MARSNRRTLVLVLLASGIVVGASLAPAAARADEESLGDGGGRPDGPAPGPPVERGRGRAGLDIPAAGGPEEERGRSVAMLAVLGCVGGMAGLTWREARRRRRAELTRRRREDRFRESFESATVGIAVVASDGTLLSVNRALCGFFGRDADTLLGMRLQDLALPGDRSEGGGGIEAMASGRVRFRRSEARFLRADGTVVWGMLSLSVLQDDSLGEASFIGMVEDITARKEAEAARMEGERRFRAILDGEGPFLGVLDPDGRVLEVIRSAPGFGGAGEKRVVGLPVWEAIGGGIDRDSRRRLREALAGAARGAFERLEVEAMGAEGEPTLIDLSITPVRDGSGRVVVLLLEGSDANDRGRLERDREQAVPHWERVRADAQRDTAALVESRDRALAAVRAKRAFLANMSHELRTTTTGLIATAELLANSDLDRQQRELVSTIRSGGDAMQGILDDILDLSKIEAGRMVLRPEPMDLRALVEDVAALLAPTAHRKGVRLLSLVSAEVPLGVVGDAKRLRQILMNLLGNAVKFTENGEVVVEVQPIGRGARGVSLSISVRDTGIGIEPGDFEAIFERFSQGAAGGGGRGWGWRSAGTWPT